MGDRLGDDYSTFDKTIDHKDYEPIVEAKIRDLFKGSDKELVSSRIMDSLVTYYQAKLYLKCTVIFTWTDSESRRGSPTSAFYIPLEE